MAEHHLEKVSKRFHCDLRLRGNPLATKRSAKGCIAGPACGFESMLLEDTGARVTVTHFGGMERSPSRLASTSSSAPVASARSSTWELPGGPVATVMPRRCPCLVPLAALLATKEVPDLTSEQSSDWATGLLLHLLR